MNEFDARNLGMKKLRNEKKTSIKFIYTLMDIKSYNFKYFLKSPSLNTTKTPLLLALLQPSFQELYESFLEKTFLLYYEIQPRSVSHPKRPTVLLTLKGFLSQSTSPFIIVT